VERWTKCVKTNGTLDNNEISGCISSMKGAGVHDPQSESVCDEKKDEATIPGHAEHERQLSKAVPMRSNAVMQHPESLRVSVNANGASEVNGVPRGAKTKVVPTLSSSEAVSITIGEF
jgi:hypothetical protein